MKKEFIEKLDETSPSKEETAKKAYDQLPPEKKVLAVMAIMATMSEEKKDEPASVTMEEALQKAGIKLDSLSPADQEKVKAIFDAENPHPAVKLTQTPESKLRAKNMRVRGEEIKGPFLPEDWEDPFQAVTEFVITDEAREQILSEVDEDSVHAQIFSFYYEF